MLAEESYYTQVDIFRQHLAELFATVAAAYA